MEKQKIFENVCRKAILIQLESSPKKFLGTIGSIETK
jgi:hypothetical protein